MKQSLTLIITMMAWPLVTLSTSLPSIEQLSRPGSYTIEAKPADSLFTSIDTLAANMGSSLWQQALSAFMPSEEIITSSITGQLCSRSQEPIFTVISAQGVSLAFALFNPYACATLPALTQQKFSSSLQMLTQTGAITALGEEIGKTIYGIGKNKTIKNTQQIFTFTKDDAEYGIAAKLVPIIVKGSIVGFCVASWWFDIGSGISPLIPKIAINIASSIGFETMMNFIPEVAAMQQQQEQEQLKKQNTQLVKAPSMAKDLFIGVLSTGVMASSLYMLPEQHLLLGQQSTILGATTLGLAVTLAAPMLEAYTSQNAYESTKNLCSIASSWFKGIGSAVLNTCSALDDAMGRWLIEYHGQ